MVLIIDDDISIRTSLSFLFKRAKMNYLAVSSPSEAIEVVKQQEIEVILMDMNYSLTTTGEEGLYLLRQVKLFKPDVPVILMTAWGNISLAVEGMRAGAFDFMTKPWNNLVLLEKIKTAIALSKHPQQEVALIQNEELSFPKIIGKSRAIQDVLQIVAKVANTNASVLITGESGTGKELIAEALHDLSDRRQNNFVKVNLGGVSQSLFESEMFGHKKGAFTDAYADREGRFSVAHKGTIFLDEIGDLDLSCQVKLLRVLQEQSFEVLGESKTKKVNVRVVSATNKDLSRMVADHRFREDLLYRINLIPIHLPPLRERRDDIPLLADYFARKASESHRLPMPKITTEALDYLQTLPYEGNIRELKNLIERVMLLSDQTFLEKVDFEKQVQQVSSESISSLEEIEKMRIMEVLKENAHNISTSAKQLGISRAALYRRMGKYNIQSNK